MLLKTGQLWSGKRFIKINIPGAMVRLNKKSLYKSYKMRAAIFLMLILTSCVKDKSCDDQLPSHQRGADAVIQWTGPVATDGCDWNILVNSQRFHPDNLDAEFQQNDLNVVIDYKLTDDKFICGLLPTPMPVIHILSIKKK